MAIGRTRFTVGMLKQVAWVCLCYTHIIGVFMLCTYHTYDTVAVVGAVVAPEWAAGVPAVVTGMPGGTITRMLARM